MSKYQKVLDDSLFALMRLYRPDFRRYQNLRNLISGNKPGGVGKKEQGPSPVSKEQQEQYFLWNNPSAGFCHQTSVYVTGLAVASLLDRTAILNYMRINTLHNSSYDKFPRLCDPRIYFDFEKLNEIVKIVTAPDLPKLDEFFNSSSEYAQSIDVNGDYASRFLFFNRKGFSTSKHFFADDIAPDEIMKKRELIVKSLDYCQDIKNRAQKIMHALKDYDAIHVRRGDMVVKGTKHLGGKLDADEVIDKTDLSKNIDTLKKLISPGRKIYIATDETDLHFFDGLREHYDIYFKEDFEDVFSNEDLPVDARNNSYYILCIEEWVLANAARFVGVLPVSTTRKVDKMRRFIKDIDHRIYNLSPEKYFEHSKEGDVWCLSYDEIHEFMQPS